MVQKLNSKICKEEIVAYCKTNGKSILKMAFGEDSQEYKNLELLETMNQVKNWKRHSKQYLDNPTTSLDIDKYKIKSDRPVERCYNCVPFDDQLRAYIISAGDKILYIKVAGE